MTTNYLVDELDISGFFCNLSNDQFITGKKYFDQAYIKEDDAYEEISSKKYVQDQYQTIAKANIQDASINILSEHIDTVETNLDISLNSYVLTSKLAPRINTAGIVDNVWVQNYVDQFYANTKSRSVVWNSNAKLNYLEIGGYTEQRHIGFGFVENSNSNNSGLNIKGFNQEGKKFYALYLSSSANNTSNVYLASGSIDFASDERIKNNIEDVESEYALNCIRKIKPVHFNYIGGDKKEIGFIAQYTKECIPECVSQINNYLPNIICWGSIKKIDIDLYEVSLEKTIKTSSITVPVGIKFVKDNKENVDCEMIEIKDDKLLILKGNLGNIIDSDDSHDIYVYGTIVNDFHVLTQSIIYTYTVSAVKQLDKELQEMKKENIEMKQKVFEMNRDFEIIRNEMYEWKNDKKNK